MPSVGRPEGPGAGIRLLDPYRWRPSLRKRVTDRPPGADPLRYDQVCREVACFPPARLPFELPPVRIAGADVSGDLPLAGVDLIRD
jgi:hypothetical protein